MEYVSLHNGMLLPKIGLGTYTIKDSRQIVSALDKGYRLFDSAIKYNNEKEIGNAILSSGYQDTCVISKVSGEHYLGRKRYLYLNRKSVKHCLRISQRNMQQCGPQIYLLHYLFKNHIKAYKELLALYEEGKINAIGICNCDTIEELQRIKDCCGQYPMIIEIELHPYYSQKSLVDFCQNHDIQVIARSPLAHGDVMAEWPQQLQYICYTYNKSVAQIILQWIVQQGIVAIPRSATIEHLQQNINIFDFSLSSREMNTIDALNKNQSFGCFTTRL